VPTDEQRVAVCRELWAYWTKSGRIHLDQAMSNYQREAEERLKRAEQESTS
jgi:hypothetical protein